MTTTSAVRTISSVHGLGCSCARTRPVMGRVGDPALWSMPVSWVWRRSTEPGPGHAGDAYDEYQPSGGGASCRQRDQGDEAARHQQRGKARDMRRAVTCSAACCGSILGSLARRCSRRAGAQSEVLVTSARRQIGGSSTMSPHRVHSDLRHGGYDSAHQSWAPSWQRRRFIADLFLCNEFFLQLVGAKLPLRDQLPVRRRTAAASEVACR